MYLLIEFGARAHACERDYYLTLIDIPSLTMYIVLGSTSPIKINATRQAFEAYFTDVKVKALALPSGVKPFPTSDEETIQGAINRAEKAYSIEPRADYAVGLEGGIARVHRHTFIKQYAAVIKDNLIGIGISSGYEAPESLLRILDVSSDESRKTIDTYFGREEILSKEGAIGVLTKSVLDRTLVSKEAVICALTRFVNPHYYE